MDTKENIGYIYKITNLVNGKMYIGQTSKFYKIRWKEHLKVAFNKNRDGYNYPLYKAFRKYGLDNFKFEVIETCNLNILDDREIFFIKEYNSFNNGYNQTLGGSGGRLLELNEIEVINKYKELKTVIKVAEFFNCNSHAISSILEKHKINIKTTTEHQKEKGNKIFQYDLNGILINTFNSRIEIGEWLVENKFYDGKSAKIVGDNFRSRFRLKDEFILFNYLWKIEKPYDKQKYIDLRKKYINKKGIELHIKNKCPICGNLKERKSLKCLECSKKEQKTKAVLQKEQKYNISRDILKEEIRTNSFLQIGKKYNVSDNSIRKWCKAYNLPYKSSEIKKYSDEEWKNI